jgi:hypothetical protein
MMISRTLSYYRKKSDSPAGEYPLTNVTMESLRTLFGVSSDNPMFDVYPVGPEQVPLLQEVLRRPLDLDRYDYFVECHATGG